MNPTNNKGVLQKISEALPLTKRVIESVPSIVSAGAQAVRQDAQKLSAMSFSDKAKEQVKRTGNILRIAENINRQVLQSPLRFATQAGLSAIEKVTGRQQTKELTSPVAKALFGADRIRTFQDYTKGGEKAISELGGSPLEAKSFPVLAIGIGGFLDFTGFGGQSDDLFKRFARETAPDVIENILRKEVRDIPEQLRKPLSRELSKITDATEARQVVDRTINEAWRSDRRTFSPRQYVEEMAKKQEEAARVADKPSFIKRLATDIGDKMVDSAMPILRAASKAAQEVRIPEKLRVDNAIDRVLRSETLASGFMKENGLIDAIRNLDDYSYKEFNQYLLAKQALDVDARGINTGRDIIKDNLLVSALAPKYEAQEQLVRQYAERLLNYAVDARLVDPNVAAMLKERYPNYVPLKRIFNELEEAGYKQAGSGGIANLSKQTVVQELKGSGRVIDDPIKSLVEKTNAAFKQGEKNKAAWTITQYKDIPGNPFGLRPLVNSDQIFKRIEILSEIKRLAADKRYALRAAAQSEKTLVPLAKKVDDIEREIQEVLDTAISMAADFDPKAKVDDIVSRLFSLEKKQMDAIDKLYMGKDATSLQQFTKLFNETSDSIKALRESLDDTIKLKQDPDKGIITFINRGKREVWEVNREIADAAKSWDVEKFNILARIFSFPTRIMKLGTTGIALPFTISNLAVDQMTAAIFKEHSGSMANPFNFFRGFLSAVRRDSLYDEVIRNAGMSTTFDISREALPTTLEAIRSKRSVGSRAKFLVKNPRELLTAVENIVGIAEQTTRIQQYKTAKDIARRAGASVAEAEAYAARQARENTVNFMRRGNWGAVLNATIPYLGASIQGSRLFVRRMKQNPARTSMRIATYLFMPTVALTAWNLSDPKRREAYLDIQPYERDNHFIYVPENPTKDENGNWNVVKIKMPPGMAKLANIVRDLVTAAYDIEPVSFPAIAADLIGSISPIELTRGPRGVLSSVTPQILKPTTEQVFNENLFTGAPIIPKSLEGLDPELQVTDRTSGTARKIGNALKVSPLRVEAFIKSTLGSIGSEVINLSDKALASFGFIPEDQIGGRTTAEAIYTRLLKARGGATENERNDQLIELLRKSDSEEKRLKNKAEAINEKLGNLPKAQANAEIRKLRRSDPELYSEVRKISDDKKKGLEYEDRLLLRFPVKNGERAEVIYNLMKDMGEQEAEAYYDELRKKKVISDTVAKQLKRLKRDGVKAK